jgi:hypothetical protein
MTGTEDRAKCVVLVVESGAEVLSRGLDLNYFAEFVVTSQSLEVPSRTTRAASG